MTCFRIGLVVVIVAMALSANADQQLIAPGTGNQSLIVVNTGPDAICDTAATGDDLQLAAVGAPAPNRPAVACDGGSGNDTVDTAAAGDDVQLVEVGAPCDNGAVIVDTGPDGVSDTTASNDDVQLLPVTPLTQTLPV